MEKKFFSKIFWSQKNRLVKTIIFIPKNALNDFFWAIYGHFKMAFFIIFWLFFDFFGLFLDHFLTFIDGRLRQTPRNAYRSSSRFSSAMVDVIWAVIAAHIYNFRSGSETLWHFLKLNFSFWIYSSILAHYIFKQIDAQILGHFEKKSWKKNIFFLSNYSCCAGFLYHIKLSR